MCLMLYRFTFADYYAGCAQLVILLLFSADLCQKVVENVIVVGTDIEGFRCDEFKCHKGLKMNEILALIAREISTM